MLAQRATETNGTRIDSSQWNIGRLFSELERASQGQCTLHDVHLGLNYKTRIAGLPILYPFTECSLMAGLAPPNATQLRFVHTEAVAEYVHSHHDPIDDLADLHTFQNSSELISLLTPLVSGNQSVCIGVFPSSAYAAVEQWLRALTDASRYRDILYVHAAAAMVVQPQASTEPQLSPRSPLDNANGGMLAVGLGLASWGGLTVFVIKLSKTWWGPMLHQALGLYGCSIPCCNLQQTSEEEEESVVREFFGQHGYTLPECDPEQQQTAEAGDPGDELVPVPAPSRPTCPPSTPVASGPDPAPATPAATSRNPNEDSIESLLDIDLDD